MHKDPSKFTTFLLRLRNKDAGEDLRKLGINLITASFIGLFLADKPYSYGLLAAICFGLIIWITGLFIGPRS